MAQKIRKRIELDEDTLNLIAEIRASSNMGHCTDSEIVVRALQIMRALQLYREVRRDTEKKDGEEKSEWLG